MNSLSPQQQEYVRSQFQRDQTRISIKHQAKLDELVPRINRVHGIAQELKDHFVEYVQELVTARTQAYKETYKRFNVNITPTDISKICFDLERITEEEYKKFSELPPPARTEMAMCGEYFERQFHRIVLAAKDDLEHTALEMNLERPEIKIREASIPPVDFSFIADSRIRTIIERDYAELQKLDANASPKSVLVLSGSVMEGLILDALVKAGKWGFEQGCREYLNDMIGAAVHRGIVKEDRLSEAVRKYRNLIHPGREAQYGMVFSESDANLGRHAVDIIIRDIRQWHINNP